MQSNIFVKENGWWNNLWGDKQKKAKHHNTRRLLRDQRGYYNLHKQLMEKSKSQVKFRHPITIDVQVLLQETEEDYSDNDVMNVKYCSCDMDNNVISNF